MRIVAGVKNINERRETMTKIIGNVVNALIIRGMHHTLKIVFLRFEVTLYQ